MIPEINESGFTLLAILVAIVFALCIGLMAGVLVYIFVRDFWLSLIVFVGVIGFSLDVMLRGRR